MSDLRTIEIDTNCYVRANAYKNTKNRNLKFFDINELPSMIEQQEREDAEATKGMTEVEKQLYLFNKGRKVRRK